MLLRFAGACVRALFVVLLIATPTMLLPTPTPDKAQTVILVGFCIGLFVIFEYLATYPSFVEFRDAPPYNRIRFVSLFLTVLLLTLVWRSTVVQNVATNYIVAIGAVIGDAIDFQYSPVRLVMGMFSGEGGAASAELIRICAGIAYLISLLSLVGFVIMTRLKGWPSPGRSLNVWVNLPTFDPTAGGDVVKRLIRDSRLNVLLGFLLPFVMPVVIKGAANAFDPISVSSPQSLIWTIAVWAFVPTSLFMRGIAMGRIGTMILQERQDIAARAEAEAEFA